MIEVICKCAKPRKLPESAVGTRVDCPRCNQSVFIVSGELVPEGAGSADFDASLIVVEGVPLIGAKFLLGGVADIQLGKLADRQIVLAGKQVSRQHCRLVRVDFGPSRWKVVDDKSTNGLFVNDERISEHELKSGDQIRVGEYVLLYGVAQWSEAAAPESAMAAADVPFASVAKAMVCPTCEKSLSPAAKICVDCGIHLKTGRPLLTSQGLDENALHAKAYAWIRLASLLVWITPMPIPIRSEAYGSRKPYAIWSIAIATVICSIAFFITQNSGGSSDDLNRPGNELMLWSPWASGKAFDIHSIDPGKIHGVAEKMTDEDREKLRAKYDPEGKLSDDQLVAAVIAGLFNSRHGEFHWYQLLTHAFLHDTGSLYGFAMHLGGNMLFLLVFGTRVNALIGDLATAIAYPILAICAATAHLLASGAGLHGPMLGASGAIMGLAGMYLILFPVHRVLCAMWISLWFWFRRLFGCKLFFVRGFWVLLIYFGYDILMSAINSHFGMGGGVAHWAHIGGFTTGMVLGLTVLFSRQFETNGGDLLSVTLGKNAWPLVGKPSRWIIRRRTAMLPPALMG